MKRWHLVLAVVSIALPAALLFLLPTGLGQLLLSPGFLVVRSLRMDNGDLAPIAVQVVVSWLFCAVMTGLAITLVTRFLWPRKILLALCALVLVGTCFAEFRGERNREYEGTWEQGFERSDFHYGGQCWRPPYWLIPTPDIHEKLDQGHTGALNVRFVGDATAIGSYGHLGQYVREVRVVRIIETRPAAPCRSSSR